MTAKPLIFNLEVAVADNLKCELGHKKTTFLWLYLLNENSYVFSCLLWEKRLYAKQLENYLPENSQVEASLYESFLPKKSRLPKKNRPQSFAILAMLVMVVSITSGQAVAEEMLIIPSYDHAVYDDGFARWSENQYKTGFVIKKSVLFDNLEKQNQDAITLSLQNNRVTGRHDRTSNHLAMTYNITVKGYCLYEADEDSSQLWSFNKVKLYMNKKPELFFGVQKSFH